MTDISCFVQFLADADDVDTWILDKLRLISSEDFGKDEASVQSLLKKHQDFSDELENYSTIIQALHEQAASLGEGVQALLFCDLIPYFAPAIT